MSKHHVRDALAEHLSAYAEVATHASRQWSRQLARRVVAQVVTAFFALLTLLVVLFVAILASWPTPYRWWVAGAILLLCVVGIVASLVVAHRTRSHRVEPPWSILAEEVATDLRGHRNAEDD